MSIPKMIVTKITTVFPIRLQIKKTMHSFTVLSANGYTRSLPCLYYPKLKYFKTNLFAVS